MPVLPCRSHSERSRHAAKVTASPSMSWGRRSYPASGGRRRGGWIEVRCWAGTLLVHLAMADLAVAGSVKASHADLARIARCSIATVARAIEDLLNTGAIEVVVPKSGSRTPTYVLPHNAVLPHDAGLEGPETLQSDDICPKDDTPPIPATPQIADMPTPQIADMPRAVEPPASPLTAPIDHAANLQMLLRALKVKPNEDLPFYWFRAEHTADYKALIRDLDASLSDLLEAVREHSISTPDLRRIADLRPMLADLRPTSTMRTA